MTNYLAYCGLKCDECPAFLAKMNNDDTLREKTVQMWGSPDYPLTLEDINCDGCKESNGLHFKFCSSCAVRNCASVKGVNTCAHCEDYGCETLETWLSQAGEESRERLENLRTEA